MKLLVWLVIVAMVATLIPLAIGAGHGYVLLVQPPYRIELSTSLFLLLVVLAFFTVYALLRLFFYTMHLPESVRTFKQNRRQKEAHEALMESLTALAEGRYNKAGKSAELALELGADPLISSLIAARAAHKLKNFGRRDFFLAECQQKAPEGEVARLLSESELLLDQRRFSEALAAIQQLEKHDAKHLSALQLELKVRRHLGDWEPVLALISQLEKRNGIEPAIARQWRLQAYGALFARHLDNPERLQTLWKNTAEDDQLDPQLALIAAHYFVDAGQSALAAEIVEKSLTRGWDTRLAEFYGECAGTDPLKQLQQAEFWLQQHHDDAGLLLSLGKLCLKQELWGKAQSYLEASLSVQPYSAAHYALAETLESQGKIEEANHHYRQSLEQKRQE
jgi:HemY protein